MINALTVGLHANLPLSNVLRGRKHYFILVLDVPVSKGLCAAPSGWVRLVWSH